MISRLHALVASALVVIAGAAAAENRIGSVVHVTEADNGRSIRVPVGLEIRARIAQPAGTRDRWEMRRDPHIELIEAPASQTAYGTGMGRGRDFRQFRIRVVRPGRFALNFGLLPSQPSAGQTPSQRIAINVDAPPAEGEERWTSDRDDSWNRNDDRRRDDRRDGNERRDRDAGPDTVEPLNERDASRQIDVPVGQEMTIALPSNASTGYYWDTNFLTNLSIIGRIEEERPRGSQIGGGGTSLVRFRVLRPGRAEVTLMYLPPGGGTSRKTLVYRFRGI